MAKETHTFEIKLHQLVALLIRFFVVYLFLTTVFQSGMFLAYQVSLNTGYLNARNLVYFGILIVMLVLIGLLWKYPLFLAKKITPKADGGAVKTSFSFEELQILCFTILGFWLALESLASILHNIIVTQGTAQSSNPAINIHLLSHGIRLTVGIGLMFASPGISKMLRKLRS